MNRLQLRTERLPFTGQDYSGNASHCKVVVHIDTP